ncbi:MAG: beta-propeller fold lactonase family protein [Longimicrobiales bacterium]
MTSLCCRVQPIVLLLVTAVAACATARPRTPAPPSQWTAYIANEASDVVTRVSYTPDGAIEVLRSIPVGTPGRIDGPHGLAISPDGRSWYVSLAHGIPGGRIAKYRVDGDSLVGRVGVGVFPTTVDVTPDGQYMFITNNNLHGEGASGISIIYAPTMTEVARPVTCVLPAGGRLNATATRHYSVCAGSDQLVEVDTRAFTITRRFSVTPQRDRVLAADVRGNGRGVTPATGSCTPSWSEPGRGLRARMVYVACERTNEIVEIDTQLWQVARRFDVGGSPRAVQIDAAGATLFAAVASDSAVAVIDLASGLVRARISTTQSGPHGMAITSDGRYLFVTSEGRGASRGGVDVIEISSLRRVASAALGYSPGGIGILPH